MTTKREMANWLAHCLAPHDKAEQTRLYWHHMGREYSAVRESFERWQAIDATTQAEIDRHCQFRPITK